MLLSTTIVVTFRPTCKRKTSSIELSSAAVFAFVFVFFFLGMWSMQPEFYFASSSIPRNHSALHRVEKRAPRELESGSKSNLTSIQAVLCLPNMAAILDLNP